MSTTDPAEHRRLPEEWQGTDWTRHGATGRSNEAPIYLGLRAEVARILRQSAHDLINGGVDTVAGVIVARLAHVHGVGPREPWSAISVGVHFRQAIDVTGRVNIGAVPCHQDGLPPDAATWENHEEHTWWPNEYQVATCPGRLPCRAGSDGECRWAECPQLRDREPEETGRHCPLDVLDPEQ